MNKYTFSTQSGKAYYCNSIPGFINDNSASIVGQLVKHSFEVNKEQSDAWENQIVELQKRLEQCYMDGDIIFEYDIVRLGKRIDVILLIKNMVFSLEFKNGKKIFTAQDARGNRCTYITTIFRMVKRYLQHKMHSKPRIMRWILRIFIKNQKIYTCVLF